MSSLIVNVFAALTAKRGTKPKLTVPADFMPEWKSKQEQLDDQAKEPEKQSVEQMKAALEHINRIFNKNKSKRTTPPKKKKDEHRTAGSRIGG